MVVLAQDLFQSDSGNVSSKASSAATSSSLDFSNFEPITSFFGGQGIQSFIIRLNYFTLAWCIFYSILFVGDFFFCRMYYSDGDLSKEKTGVDGIHRAAKIWWSYLICWIFLVIYSIFPITGILTIIIYFFKIFFVDLAKVLDIVHDDVPFSGVFTTYRNIVAPIQRLFTIPVRTKKAKKK